MKKTVELPQDLAQLNKELKQIIKSTIRKNVLVKNVAQQQPYTFVELTLKIGRIEYVGMGFSKANPCDEFDGARGIYIAVGRALKAIFVQVVDDLEAEIIGLDIITKDD
jgi:hypothetical protein